MGHDLSSGLLSPGDPDPVIVVGDGERSPFLIVCDHAGRATPQSLRRLGLPDAVFETHIAWDIGVLKLGEQLGRLLDARVIAQTYSRLVVDCNRPPGHPQSIPDVSDGVAIPGNRGLGPADIEARLAAIHRPYHAAIGAEMAARASQGRSNLLVCLHSFTPTMAGVARPWEIGVLHLGNSPASRSLLEALDAEPGLVVGDNQPYEMGDDDHTAPFHALAKGLDVLEIEVRQDIAGHPAGRARIAELLARLLPTALERSRRDQAARDV
jgi:predicted N-formylglutamate amidohydrolase